MKTIHTVVFTFIISLTFGQVIDFDNYFDANLKGNPSVIKEGSTFSILDFQDKNLQDYAPKDLVMYTEYYFDTIGKLIKEYNNLHFDSIGIWIDYTKVHEKNYGDSIIRISYLQNGTEDWREKRYLDKDGYLITRIIDFPRSDTSYYKRDSSHKIISIYNHIINTDTQVILSVNNTYDTNSNLQSQRIIKKHISAMFDMTSNDETLIEYSYILDKYDNWIVRLSIQDDKIISISQREIQYW